MKESEGIVTQSDGWQSTNREGNEEQQPNLRFLLLSDLREAVNTNLKPTTASTSSHALEKDVSFPLYTLCTTHCVRNFAKCFTRK